MNLAKRVAVSLLHESAGLQSASVAESESTGEAHPSQRARLYRLLWRWHFYAGVLTAPVLMVAAVTGALYVFIDELKPIFYPELMLSESLSEAAPRSLDDLMAGLLREYPKAQVLSVAEPPEPGQNVEFAIRLPEGETTIQTTAMVDPISGRVAGLYNQHDSFFGIVLHLHRRLFLGPIGRLLVELTASWGIVLLITGCYLWWPRGKGKAEAQGFGVWRPRLRGPFRIVLRDWHAVVGFYGLTTAAFVLATGLFFTQLFGPGFNWIAKQTSTTPATPKSEAAAGRKPITLAAAVQAAEPQLPGYGPVRITLPKAADEAFQVARRDTSQPHWKSPALIDAYSGRFLALQGWNTAAPIQKVRMSIYPLHVGSIFGLTTKVLALLTCLALLLLAVTGVWMWWRRRPRGTWGLPPSDATTHVPLWLSGVILLLAVLLPALGGSLILIMLGEFVWFRLVRRPQSA